MPAALPLLDETAYLLNQAAGFRARWPSASLNLTRAQRLRPTFPVSAKWRKEHLCCPCERSPRLVSSHKTSERLRPIASRETTGTLNASDRPTCVDGAMRTDLLTGR